MSFTVRYDDNNQELMLAGSMSPQSAGDLADFRKIFEKSIAAVSGTLYFNVKRLVRLNNIAFHELASLVSRACQEKPELRISIVTSSVVGWSARKFGVLARISPNISVEQYDKEFYPGQGVLEDGGFIPILRTQTKMTWRHEREILPRHGLKPGMAVADICCGIGDFAVLVFKEFEPTRLVAVDHAKPSLAYARKVAADFGIRGIEYIYGDAANLLIEDNQFDFVTCRHSLQVFNKPELILKELYRICKPGGRVYISNEKNSHCLGEPRAESIQWTYNEVAKLWAHFQMDIELGPKSRRYMIDGGFEDIRMESFMVTNLDGDPQDFADVIQAWENVYAGQMAVSRGDSEEFIRKFRQGFQDHIFAALHPKGYAGWPIWVASGRKPA
jgi:ubiquinone/menaquinone biosynthesis C-methylase UbiE/ABC-type transporter Mla MlaB component